jgi:hypothetical protein
MAEFIAGAIGREPLPLFQSPGGGSQVSGGVRSRSATWECPVQSVDHCHRVVPLARYLLLNNVTGASEPLPILPFGSEPATYTAPGLCSLNSRLC